MSKIKDQIANSFDLCMKKFTIENYINGLIDEVKNAPFAYISNVCVDKEFRNLHIGTFLMQVPENNDLQIPKVGSTFMTVINVLYNNEVLH